MKKSFPAFIFLVLMMSYSLPAFSYGFYYGLFTGVNNFSCKHELKKHYHINGELDSGHIFGSVAGLDLAILVVEGEISRQKSYFHNHRHHKGSIKSHYYMLNGFFNSPWSFIFTPYAGLGIGYKKQKISERYSSYSYGDSSYEDYSDYYNDEFCSSKDFKVDRKKETLRSAAWQAIAGVKCPLLCGIELAIEIRYKGSFKEDHMNIYHSGIFLKYFF